MMVVNMMNMMKISISDEFSISEYEVIKIIKKQIPIQ